jgi:serine/threonine-protein kinase RsbT
VENEIRILIRSEADIVAAREQGRILAKKIGFNGSGPTIIATAISEVARNILQYADHGEIIIDVIHQSKAGGILVIARDDGPGITDVSQVMQVGYTTGKGLGLGLPGARRLMDEFQIVSEPGKGTTVTMKKWV